MHSFDALEVIARRWPTKYRLATAIRCAQGDRDILRILAAGAERGVFDEYEDTADMNVSHEMLVELLMHAGADQLAKRVMAGEFKNTWEEGRAWMLGRLGPLAERMRRYDLLMAG